MKMFANMNIDFSSWLENELKNKGWSQAELGRRAGISRAAINNILTEHRQPGPDACRGIARALDLPEEEVFRRAGLLSPKADDAPNLAEWIHLFLKASPEERDRMLELARVLSKRSRKP